MPPTHRVDAALVAGLEPAAAPTCATAAEGADRVRCRIEARWAGTGDLSATSLALWDEHRVVVGLEAEHWMDGGFRGRLHLVPEAPRGPYARHLAWVRDAHRVMADVLAGVAQRAPPAAPMRFRHQGVVYAFFRSVGRTTPSAYASDWRVGYNVSGSLLGTRDGVIDTLFHEIFHLNDQGDAWSEAALRSIHDGIVARCGARSACLAPYAPTKTIVRGGTYYSFQPDNGDAVHEYAAEVATRWFQEHRALLEGSAPPAPIPFRCGAAENAAAWKAVTDTFFAGVDLTSPCKPPPP